MRVVIALLALVLAPQSLEAQGANAGEPRKAKGRQVWLAATHLPKKMNNPVTVMVGDKFHQIPLSKRRASQAIPIGKEQVIRLVRRIPKAEEPGEFTIKVVAQAAVPAETRQALIILIPATAPGKDIEFHAKVQNLASYRGGDYLFLNLAPTRVAVQLGETKLGMGPGETTIYDASSIKKSTNAAVQYHYYDLAQQKWRLISSSTIVLRPTRRELCVFSWDERYKRINYHGITFPVEP